MLGTDRDNKIGQMLVTAEAGWWIFGGSLRYFFLLLCRFENSNIEKIFEENKSLSYVHGSYLSAARYLGA